LGWQHGAARIGRRGDCAAVGPGPDIQGVGDAIAQLSIGRACAVSPMPLKCLAGEAEEARGSGVRKKPAASRRIRHVAPSKVRSGRRRAKATVAEESRVGGWRRCECQNRTPPDATARLLTRVDAGASESHRRQRGNFGRLSMN
jgi:hypothetical protein